jgi:hypothetical protein
MRRWSDASGQRAFRVKIDDTRMILIVSEFKEREEPS